MECQLLDSLANFSNDYCQTCLTSSKEEIKSILLKPEMASKIYGLKLQKKENKVNDY